jgi:hypothetical protein
LADLAEVVFGRGGLRVIADPDPCEWNAACPRGENLGIENRNAISLSAAINLAGGPLVCGSEGQ